MGEQRHTPGPWGVVESHDKGWQGWFAIGPVEDGLPMPDISIAACHYGGGAMRDGIKPWGAKALKENRAAAKANARLIAAAPDLMAACGLVISLLEISPSGKGINWEHAAKNLKSAIAKATGQEA